MLLECLVIPSSKRKTITLLVVTCNNLVMKEQFIVHASIACNLTRDREKSIILDFAFLVSPLSDSVGSKGKQKRRRRRRGTRDLTCFDFDWGCCFGFDRYAASTGGASCGCRWCQVVLLLFYPFCCFLLNRSCPSRDANEKELFFYFSLLFFNVGLLGQSTSTNWPFIKIVQPQLFVFLFL